MLRFCKGFRSCTSTLPVNVSSSSPSPLLLLRFTSRHPLLRHSSALPSALHLPPRSGVVEHARLSLCTFVLEDLSPRQVDFFFQCVDFVKHGLQARPPAWCEDLLDELVRQTFGGTTALPDSARQVLEEAQDEKTGERNNKKISLRPLLDVVFFDKVGPFDGWFHHGYEADLLPAVCAEYLHQALVHSFSGTWLQRRRMIEQVKSAVYQPYLRASILKSAATVTLSDLRNVNLFYVKGLVAVCARNGNVVGERVVGVSALLEPGARYTANLKSEGNEFGCTPNGWVTWMRYALASRVWEDFKTPLGGWKEGLRHSPPPLRAMSDALQTFFQLKNNTDHDPKHKNASLEEKVSWKVEAVLPTGCALLDYAFAILFNSTASQDERGETWKLLTHELEKQHSGILAEELSFLEHFEVERGHADTSPNGEMGLYDAMFLHHVLQGDSEKPLSPAEAYPVHAGLPEYLCKNNKNKNSPSRTSGKETPQEANKEDEGEFFFTPLVGFGLNAQQYLTKLLAACDLLTAVYHPFQSDETQNAFLASTHAEDVFLIKLQHLQHMLRVTLGRRYMLAPHPSNWSPFDRQRALPFVEGLSVSLAIRKRFVVLVLTSNQPHPAANDFVRQGEEKGEEEEKKKKRPTVVQSSIFFSLSMLFPGLTPAVVFAPRSSSWGRAEVENSLTAVAWSYFPCQLQGLDGLQACYLRLPTKQFLKIKTLVTEAEVEKQEKEELVFGLVCCDNATVEEVFPLQEWYASVFPSVLSV